MNRAGGRRLCAEREVREGEGCGFIFGAGMERQAIFVIRWNGVLRGYRNSCPHLGTPLDWPENRFFDAEDRHLMCRTHGAMFRPEDGYCFEGPCSGRSLKPIAIEAKDGDLYWLD